MKITVLLVAFFTITNVALSQCSDLFFSEYVEGSSNNKAIEIYNPTSSAIDLSDYVVYRANNGATIPSDSLFPAGMLAAGDVYVAGNPSAVVEILNVSDTTHTITFFNGDDALWLKKISTGTVLDVIGELGVDPGSSWPVGSGATANYTLVRMANIQQGTTSWTIGQNQWDVYPQDSLTFLGSHTMIPCGAPCTNTASTIADTVCDTYTAPDGMTYTSTGQYTATIPNAEGCDSVITINLIVNNSTMSTLTESACGSYTLNSVTYTYSGTYTQTVANAAGCDSTITLTLDITPMPSAPIVSGSTTYCEGDTQTALTVPASVATDSLIISGVADATLTGGLPKAIEFYVLEDIADLSSYGFGSANNGGGTDGEEFTFPAVSVTAGTYIHIATDSANFFTFFGMYPDYVDASAPNVNGDDAIELFHNGMVIDVFGDINVDGSGTAWEYMDGWAYRKDNAVPNGGVFNIGEWDFSGPNALDNEANNMSAATPFPIETYTYSPVPTAITWYSDAGLTNVLATGNSYTPAAPTGTTPYYTTATATGTNTCESAATTVNITVNALPSVTFGALDTVCVNGSVVVLTQGSPAGGIYSGTGVSLVADEFDPATAGVGTFTLTYDYTDGNGCAASATSDIVVDGCAGIEELNNEAVVLFPNPATSEVVVAGVTAQTLQVIDLSGTVVSESASNTISVEGLASGMYILNVITENGSVAKSFVKK